ncbi:MAG: PD-(D/E)XK nuclease family protein [Candidatus Thorarchaeota archaeon]
MGNFVNHLEEIIQEGIEAGSHDYSPDPRKGHFRASNLPYCSRKLVFQHFLRWDYPRESPIMLARNAGIAIHKFLQGLMDSDPIQIEEKVEIELEGLKLMGHADLIILDLDRYYVLLDIKTTDNSEAIAANGPKKAHVAQLVIYLVAVSEKLRRENRAEKPLWGVLWYLDRRNSISELLNSENWQFFDIELDDAKKELIATLVKKGKRIQRMVTQGLLPEIDAEPWECSNQAAVCPYYTLCHEDYLERIAEIDSHR